MDGFINLYKPLSMSSGTAVGRVKRLLPRGTAVGHCGTLDPEAEGVLPICVGKATRLFDYIVDKRKTYVAEMTLGVITDTQDATGEVIETREALVSENDIISVLPRFTGDILQTPPMYSAIKRGGKPLYAYARKGETLEIEPRPARIDSIELVGRASENKFILRVECGKGVYIRTLVHDIGLAVGAGAHMSALRRARCGAFSEEDAVRLDELADVASALLPMDFPLVMPKVMLPESARVSVKNGAPQACEGEGLASVYVAGDFAGIGRLNGGILKFRAMLL